MAGTFGCATAPVSADFIGWTANVRSVPTGFLVNVFAVSNSATDTLVNRYGSVGGVSGGYVATNASGGFRQAPGASALFAPNGEQSWNTLDSFFTVGGAFASGEWFAEPATQGDPNWAVPFTGTGCATLNSFSSNSTAICTNPNLNSVPAEAGWFVSGGIFAPVRSLASLDCRVASSSTAAAAAQYGTLVAQLYITDTAPNRTVSWRMGATMRHANGTVSQGIYEFTIPVNPLAVTTYTDAVLQSSPASYWRFEES